LDTPVIDDLHRYAPVLPLLKRERHRSPVLLDQLLIDLRPQVLRKPCPTVFRPGHWEEDLARVNAAPVVVGIEHPHGDVRLAARFDLAALGVAKNLPIGSVISVGSFTFGHGPNTAA